MAKKKKKTSSAQHSQNLDAKKAESGGSDKNSTKLVKLALDNADFWHTSSKVAFATCTVDEHCENYKVKSKKFARWLAGMHYSRNQSSCGQQELSEAIHTLEAHSLFSCPEFSTFLRVAGLEEKILIDLGRENWEAVSITASGWHIVANPDVRFRRPKSTRPLPLPKNGGSVELLRSFLNVSDKDWPLVLGWLVAAFRPMGPYCVLELLGEQGTAKTTTARVLRSLIDPSASLVSSEPRSVRDLMIAAINNWILCFDNLSYLSHWQSDALCRLSTGGGFTTRELYTDDEETILDAQRPVIITGIEDVCVRSDLLDRSILIDLAVLPAESRRTEVEFWREFGEAQPAILGALLDAVSEALRRYSKIALEAPPRMADFAYWVVASEPSLGLKPGSFMKAYENNRSKANEIAVENSPLATAILLFMSKRSKKTKQAKREWAGTATALLMALVPLVDPATRQQRAWPKNAKALSGHLKRLGPNLRALGIQVERTTRGSGNDKRKLIVLRKGR